MRREDAGAARDPEALTRRIMRVAAAKALMQNFAVAIEIAGVEPAKFVQIARQCYQAADLHFSDSDLREIHAILRRLCVRDIGPRVAQIVQ